MSAGFSSSKKKKKKLPQYFHAIFKNKNKVGVGKIFFIFLAHPCEK